MNIGGYTSPEADRVRIVHVVTSSLTVRLMTGQPDYLSRVGFEVIVVSSPGEELRTARCSGAETVAVTMAREIAPWQDLLALWALLKLMRQLRPTVVNFSTPKAALLAAIAARLVNVPVRIYLLRGLRFETATGLKRKVLLLSERIGCACAHRVICVSESLRQKAIELGIVDAGRTVVLASGSSNGVDARRFAGTPEALERGARLRRELGIPLGAPVVGFVGRLTRDKGISELVEAYLELRTKIPDLKLLLVGDLEEGDPVPPRIRRCLEGEEGIFRAGFVQDPADYYHAMDVLALPTYREGFPTVVLEAHAAGKPVVAARATGVVDAVVDGVTGILVPVGDAKALAGALALVLGDRNFAAGLGLAGRERVLREFRQEMIWDALAQEYLQLLQAEGLSVPTPNPRSEAAEVLTAGAVVSR
jgi:glycosyltransferase involved in cell wall biosynthesis